MEFEVPNLEVGGSGAAYATAEVELWDISGDKRWVVGLIWGGGGWEVGLMQRGQEVGGAA